MRSKKSRILWLAFKYLNNMKQPLAYIDPEAKIADNVVIEPFVTIDKNVVIGAGSRIRSNAVILAGTRIGENCTVFPGAVIGAEPQDLKFKNYFIRLSSQLSYGSMPKIVATVGATFARPKLPSFNSYLFLL